MKHTLIFFTYVLTIMLPSHCMENIQQEKILREITLIEAPIKAQYLTKDRAIIMGRNGCSIINPTTNQEIINIDNEYNQYYCYLDVSPDKKEVALSRHTTIKNIQHRNWRTNMDETKTIRTGQNCFQSTRKNSFFS